MDPLVNPLHQASLTIRTRLPLLQASFRNMPVHDRLIATVTSIRTNVVLRSFATTHAVLVAVLAHTIIVILRGRTLGHAEWSIPRVFAFRAIFCIRPCARTVAFIVT